MCHTSDICVLCMVTSVTWSWPWTEHNIKHLLNKCLALYFRSTRGKFWPKTDSFEVSTARNLKAPILTFDLTLTWHVTSFGKFRGCFRIVSSRAFERRIVRLSAAIRSRVMTWGRLTPPPPPPSKSRVAKYPSKCRVNGLCPPMTKCKISLCKKEERYQENFSGLYSYSISKRKSSCLQRSSILRFTRNIVLMTSPWSIRTSQSQRIWGSSAR